MPNEVVVRTAEWDKDAVKLAYEYAGFTDAATLTDSEKIEALTTLVPVALKVVDEARDTIEGLRTRLDRFMLDEIKNLVEMNVLHPMTYEQWTTISIPELDNQTPQQLVAHDRVENLYDYVEARLGHANAEPIGE